MRRFGDPDVQRYGRDSSVALGAYTGAWGSSGGQDAYTTTIEVRATIACVSPPQSSTDASSRRPLRVTDRIPPESRATTATTISFFSLEADYPSSVQNYDQVPSAVATYTAALTAAADASVVIASIGELTNLRDILVAEPALFAAKVTRCRAPSRRDARRASDGGHADAFATGRAQPRRDARRASDGGHADAFATGVVVGRRSRAPRLFCWFIAALVYRC